MTARLVLLIAIAELCPGAGTAQTAPMVRDVGLSADSIEIGDRFELRFTVDLPEGTVAFLPDSLEAGAIESFGPVEWAVAGTGRDRRELSVTYPLIAFGTGSVSIPELEVFVAPGAASTAAGLSAGGDPVGSWSAFRDAPGTLPAARLLFVPEQRVEVLSVLLLDDITTQLRPRPPADVSGGDRDWLSSALATLFGIVLLGVGIVSARDWVRAERRPDHPSPTDPRTRALEELDALMDGAPHRAGRVRDFYRGWSDVVRRYVEGLAPEWGPAWTSTELMADLRGASRSIAVQRALSPDGIASEMRLAERVKFGGLRPDPETAEAHWRSARAWIAGSGREPTAGPEGEPVTGSGREPIGGAEREP